MKHYVLKNDHANVANAGLSSSDRVQNIDVILHKTATTAAAEMIAEFFQALNTLVEDHTYVVNLRVPAEEPVGGPLYWNGRTAVFWGDLENSWDLSGPERCWVSQVLSLSSRTILVGGAVLLQARSGRADQTTAAIHPNFEASALECGLTHCGQGTLISEDGRTHSAATRLSAIRLLAEFVSVDHGEHLADSLRGYIGLSEPKRKYDSQVAARLVHRSGGDPLVTQAIELMLGHIEEPMSIPDLSNHLRTSTRQLQRRFLSKTGTKLLTTYRELRLERAHGLLRFTDMAPIEISTATGFSSNVALSRAFQAHYRTKPEDVRSGRYLGKLSRS